MGDLKFFKNAGELKKWFIKNHSKQDELWVSFLKAGVQDKGQARLTQKEANDLCLCFGWVVIIIKGVDEFSYKIRFTPRKIGGAWSLANIKRFQELKKQGLTQASGEKIFKLRDRDKSDNVVQKFSPLFLTMFKSNKVGWAFFNRQNPSYQKYMTLWVMAAKQEATKLRRLNMLIEDSSQNSKLKRVVEAQKKVKKTYTVSPQNKGQQPIEEGRGIGPLTAGELRSVGIETLEQLRSIGYEKSFERLCRMYPNRQNLNMLKALIGAIENQNHRELDPELVGEAKQLLRELRSL